MRARSLLCTHQGCEVRWRPDLDRYRCPCHQGMFGSDGEPVSGPPKRALAAIAVHVEAGEIVVDAPAAP